LSNEEVIRFFRVDKQLWTSSALSHDLLEILMRVKICFAVLHPGGKPTKDPSALIQLFYGVFFKTLGIHVCMSAENMEAMICYCILFELTSLFMEIVTQICQSFLALLTPDDLTHRNQPKNSPIQGFEHFRSDFIATCRLPSL